MPLPIAVGEHHRVGRAGSIVSLGKPTSRRRLYAQGLERAVGDVQRLDLLGLTGARHSYAVVGPQTEILKRTALLAIREVHGGRAVDVARDSSHARRQVPDPRQLLSFRIRQRFDQNSVDDAEDGRVGADAERQRNQGDRGEHRGAPESPEDVPH